MPKRIEPRADPGGQMVPLTASRLLLLAFVACAWALIVLPDVADAAGKRSRKAQCAGADLQPAPGNLAKVRAAVVCLHNRERTARGLAPLREHRKLRAAAAGHSEHMVARRFFAHDSPGGAGMADRILRTGYAAGDGWAFGENLAWGTGRLATAAEIQRGWMESSGHKANVLRREYREIGIGIVVGVPVDVAGAPGATYTADFGVRR